MGEVFAGRYELVDPIGRGGVGVVWRAWDHRRRRYVAAKVLQQSDAHALLRFVREQALRIDHPHVLAPASWAADDDQVLFTMDLVTGGSLVHLVGDYGPLPPSLVCVLLDQLLSGLAAVHAEGVVHRDIKPANVLLEATGTARPRLRLSDFGIAMRLGEPRLTETDYVVGTPGYLAPEQLIGAEPDFTADLFATGLVALYLLEGAKPDTKALVEYFVANGTPGPPRGVPGPLWEVVATLLQPDPAARFRTATGARKALAAAGELLPEPGPDDEQVEIFDQLGPLPEEFGPEGPLRTPRTVTNPAATLPRAQDAVAGAAQQVGPSGADGTASARPAGTCGTGSGPARPTAGSIPPRPTVAPTSSAARTSTPGASPPGTAGPTAPDSGTSACAVSGAHGSPAVPTPPPPAAPPGPAPLVVPPRPAVDPTPSQRPPTMSDTGSFHLPPPLPREALGAVSRPPRQPSAPPAAAVMPASAPAHVPHHEPTPTSSAAPPSARTPSVRQPGHGHDVQPPYAPTTPQEITRYGGEPAAPRPGPPAKVAVPVLLLALACFTVGFWALSRI
ncbi:serine/threonine-protein kinase [Streptomyces chiangmaiensis]|uniref:non-specific serine/threonine protein kinase n=1 Tax=Streptomyces chiangmaiensis TaxID=766497 RepID=A0ABU7F9X0_9ACTN|nr:protein kinase [Streptomyces chiangmaiensis]MED7820919.1 protein kinase [Streptomyces chiangmaiensis]